MHMRLSEAVDRVRKISRGGALPDKVGSPCSGADAAPRGIEPVEDIPGKKGAGRGMLLRAASLVEYVLLISCVSLVILLAGPGVADSIQGQFGTVANTINAGPLADTNGGNDFPGGGSGGAEDPDKPGAGDEKPDKPAVKIVTWADGTDEEVAAMVAAADRGEIKLTDYWRSGDTRKVTLSAMGASNGLPDTHAEQTVEYVLSDPGHFTLANGKKCNFTVIQKDCLKETGKMNTSITNSCGWEAAPRRTWCNTTYRNALPAGLKPIFKQFKVTTAIGAGSGTTVSSDYFSLFSEKEVFGSTSYADSTAESANTRLDYFKTSGNRVKKANGSADWWWWERSPCSDDSVRFCDVDKHGGASYINAASDYGGLAPFGCI